MKEDEKKKLMEETDKLFAVYDATGKRLDKPKTVDQEEDISKTPTKWVSLILTYLIWL